MFRDADTGEQLDKSDSTPEVGKNGTRNDSSSASYLFEDDFSAILSESLFHSCISTAASVSLEMEHGKKICGSEQEKVDEEEGGIIVSASAKDELTPCSLETPKVSVQPNGNDPARTSAMTPQNTAPNTDANTSAKVSQGLLKKSTWNVLSKSDFGGVRPTIRSITFNRDRTCLLLSTSHGVRIRTLESLQPASYQPNQDKNNNISQQSWVHDVPLPPDGATYAQLLHNTSLLAVIRPSSPRCLFLFNAKNAALPLAALPLSAAVRRIELQRRVLTALTVDGRLHVFYMNGGENDFNNGGSNEKSVDDNSRDKMEKEKCSPPSSSGVSLRPIWVQTLNVMHPSDSLRNLTRGIDVLNTGAYFDLSNNEDESYLVCKSFRDNPGTVRVYNPLLLDEVSTGASGNISIGGRSACASIASSAGVSTASSWDRHTSFSSKKVKRRMRLLTTINAHEHCVTRMIVGDGRFGGNCSDNFTKQTFLATTSSNGTTIRVFGLPQGNRLWEWHRGSRPCQFHSVSWNGAADRFVTYGNSGTIHIFDWKRQKQKIAKEIGRKEEIGYFDKGDDYNDDVRDFEEVRESRGTHETIDSMPKPSSTAAGRPLLRRIGASFRRRTVEAMIPISQNGNSSTNTSAKHRSFAKLKFQAVATSANDPNNKSQRPQLQYPTLVVALLDRSNNVREGLNLSKDNDTLVVCSLDGELRQYSVKADGSFGLVQMEDVLFRDAGTSAALSSQRV